MRKVLEQGDDSRGCQALLLLREEKEEEEDIPRGTWSCTSFSLYYMLLLFGLFGLWVGAEDCALGGEDE